MGGMPTRFGLVQSKIGQCPISIMGFSMKKFVLAAAVCAAFSTAASAQDLSGARIEARIGWETPTISGDGDVFKIGQAVSFGAEAGYDLKAGDKVVVGPYAIYEFSGVKACDAGDCLKVKGTWGAGGRVGFVVGGNGMIYGKLGYSDIRLKANVGTFTETVTKGGVGGGLGYEANFGKSTYWKIEANYADFGKIQGVNFQRRQVAAGVGLRF
jgi:outer membrane immunogenic protein